MKYQLKNCRTGEKAIYPTTVEIYEEGENLVFIFEAEHTKYYCPYEKYNDIHSYGDACEVLIGTDPDRKTYYEAEISPKNGLMLAKMTYCGIRDPITKEPELIIDFVAEKDCFIQGESVITEKGYTAKLKVKKEKVFTGAGDIYFNVYRLETDGGELNKHLFALNPTLGDWFHVPDRYIYLKDFIK